MISHSNSDTPSARGRGIETRNLQRRVTRGRARFQQEISNTDIFAGGQGGRLKIWTSVRWVQTHGMQLEKHTAILKSNSTFMNTF